MFREVEAQVRAGTEDLTTVQETTGTLPGDRRQRTPLPEQRPPVEDVPEPDETPTCILLAGDSADMRAHLQRLLAQRYTVVAAGDGADAVAAARAHQPDLVLTDVMMPGIDGLALVAALRADPRTAAVPVLLLSSPACEEAAIEGLQAGADDYLIKPFSARELLTRVRAHVTIAQARRREAERTQQRDEFLATVTHDLKNPLTSMMGISELLQHRVEHQEELDREGMARALGTLISTAQRMVGQVNELLDTTRLHMGRSLDLDPQPTDLVAMAHRLTMEYARNGDRHTVWLDTAEQVLEGLYDQLRLERALSNLLDNAIKYSPWGGAITLSLVRTQGDTGTWVTIRVSDQGLGIPEADLPRISERFFRASNVVGHTRGNGLGLAGVRQIVEGHGGSIAITSTEGAGTTVNLRLPHRAIPCDGNSMPREPEGTNGL